MAVLKYTLTSHLFAQAFPFHLGFNSDLKIVQLGDVLQRIHAHVPLLQQPIEQHFELQRPIRSFEFSAIQKRIKSLFWLKSKSHDLDLKGQMMFLEEENIFLFLCSVWVPNTSHLSTLGIQLKDFAIHDATVDLLFLQRTSQNALNDVKQLSQELTQQKQQLQTALEIQENLTKTSETQAQQLEKMLINLQNTQAQLIQTEKMSGLGRLAAGIAHEINNPVNFIQGNISHLILYMQDLLDLIQLYQNIYPLQQEIVTKMEEIDFNFLVEDLPDLLSSMKIGAERIEKIVQAFRTFSRLDEAELKKIDIHQAIDSTLVVLNNRLKRNFKSIPISVIKQYSQLPTLECYAAELNQVFMHILSNAIDALEKAYQSKLCRGQAEDEPTILISTALINPKAIRIEIADNGAGISKTIQPKIFDPFFTTKSVGEGAGLGLSTSYQIVTEKHQGKLFCRSTCQGTIFSIELPLNQTVRLTSES